MSESRTLMGAIRTFLTVSLITVMVWLLAESRMVRTRTLDAQINLITIDSSGGADLVVRQATGHAQIRTVSIQIEGSTARLDRFVRVLQNRIELRIGREIPAEPGLHTLELRELLRQSSDLTVHGLTVTEVSPETITVEVDELVTRDFPARVIMPAGVEMDGAPRAEPASVRVRAPSSVLDRVDSNEAIVQVEPGEVTQLTPGRLETIPGVPVELSGIGRVEWATEINPGQVDVLVTLRTLTQRYVVDRLPVQVLIAPGEIGRWVVEINEADKDLINIEIEGPARAIDQLRSGAIVPRAYVSLSFEDLGRQIESKPAQILGLPPGCRVVSPPATVNLAISRLDPVIPVESGPSTEIPQN